MAKTLGIDFNSFEKGPTCIDYLTLYSYHPLLSIYKKIQFFHLFKRLYDASIKGVISFVWT